MGVNRRTLLTTLGVGAIGAGSVFSSGALTQMEASRDFGLAIVPDDNAQLALRPGEREIDAVDIVDGGLTIDIEAANRQADTRFSNAIEIENQHQSAQSLYVYVPRSVDIVGDSLVATSDVGHESVEFLVDDDALDISLPPEYPDGAFSGGKGADTSISFGKVMNTGAFELGFGETVQVSLTVLVTPGDEDELDDRILRVRAQRDEPDEDDWDDVGALENLAPGDVLRSH